MRAAIYMSATAMLQRAFYLLHSPDDRVCPFRMAEQATAEQGRAGAAVKLATYEGGHGWRGPVYPQIRAGIEWLEKNAAPATAVSGDPPVEDQLSQLERAWNDANLRGDFVWSDHLSGEHGHGGEIIAAVPITVFIRVNPKKPGLVVFVG